MNKRKIFNDPVYGFITLPFDILFDIIEHPYFQRLRRIKQLGLTHYVYPGALHTRFHHALGAMHLMQEAVAVLRSKDIEITEEEYKSVLIAILLHDIGHGPFSHALEHTILNVHHEQLSLWFMEILNEKFEGELDMAIEIFKGTYTKNFLHQLVSSQLDMDRMDYLNRDSFFTGVAEGVIGYDRIIKMLSVKNDELVVEEKGIYSIEKFLISRRLMYWQVYLHKAVLSAEQMLIKVLQRAQELSRKGEVTSRNEILTYFLNNDISELKFEKNKAEYLEKFSQLDDIDIVAALKEFQNKDDYLLKFLSKSILYRQLFKVHSETHAPQSDFLNSIRQKIVLSRNISESQATNLILTGKESNQAYSADKNEIKILMKDGLVIPISSVLKNFVESGVIIKHFLCYPK